MAVYGSEAEDGVLARGTVVRRETLDAAAAADRDWDAVVRDLPAADLPPGADAYVVLGPDGALLAAGTLYDGPPDRDEGSFLGRLRSLFG